LSFSSPCDMLTFASFQGFNFLKLLSFDPASIGSVLLDVDDQQLQPTGVVNQLRHMKDCSLLRLTPWSRILTK
jgi:hypothetical protein